mmetsp:Transcript_77544/g.251034  ORF Transcript_77544/g.251034 Transcript_77544/m.251034 type:complete len:382 (-) Transcript_77544:644-1789(-)
MSARSRTAPVSAECSDDIVVGVGVVGRLQCLRVDPHTSFSENVGAASERWLKRGQAVAAGAQDGRLRPRRARAGPGHAEGVVGVRREEALRRPQGVLLHLAVQEPTRDLSLTATSEQGRAPWFARQPHQLRDVTHVRAQDHQGLRLLRRPNGDRTIAVPTEDPISLRGRRHRQDRHLVGLQVPRPVRAEGLGLLLVGLGLEAHDGDAVCVGDHKPIHTHVHHRHRLAVHLQGMQEIGRIPGDVQDEDVTARGADVGSILHVVQVAAREVVGLALEALHQPAPADELVGANVDRPHGRVEAQREQPPRRASEVGHRTLVVQLERRLAGGLLRALLHAVDLDLAVFQAHEELPRDLLERQGSDFDAVRVRIHALPSSARSLGP